MDQEWIPVTERLPEIPEGKFAVSVLVAEFDSMYADFVLKHNPTDPFAGMTAMYGSYGYTRYPDPIPEYLAKLGHKANDPISSWFEGTTKDKDFITSVSGPKGSEPSPFWDEVTHWMYFPDPPPRPTN